jgi:hypothetical protein
MMEAGHWSIQKARDIAAVFRALPAVAPQHAFLALAGGAWPREVKSVLTRESARSAPPFRSCLASEFTVAFFIPVSEAAMASLAELADRHAEPEVALHVAVFTDLGRFLEWFDAPDDPIAVSASAPADEVARFAQAVGGTCERVERGV